MSKKRTLYIIGGLILIVLLLSTGIIFCAKNGVSRRAEFQKGMNYVAWTKEGYRNANSIRSMKRLGPLGANYAGVVVTWYQDQFNSTKIFPLDEKTPSDDSLLFAIRKLRDYDLKIMLKPHLDILRTEGKWRGDIDFTTEEEWEDWFSNYADFVMHYARLAQEEDVELFCIGTELTKPALNQTELWRDLIKDIRSVYKGQLTYAANWHEEFVGIEFWDELDYAGIDAYFPLNGSPNPTKEELKESWEGWLEIIRDWQEGIDKPVIFPEIGYKSSAGASERPWEHAPSGEVDLQLQVDCYEALFETFWAEPWFYGAYWWYWGANPNMGGEFHRGFTPQNKPAEDAVKERYNEPIPPKMY